MFVFGTQYLRGFTPARDQWMRDFENMKRMGFNTVRGWLVWNAIELREGEIDHEYLHAFLDAAEQNDIGLGLLFHLHAAPEWLTRKYPEYFYVDIEGKRFEPAMRTNTPSGGWPGLCFDHEPVREIERGFMERVIDSIGARKGIAFWEPMNEPHVWVELEKKPVGFFCFCPATRAKFRAWLMRKYGDLPTLNAAWGRHHNDWDEVRPPTWRMGYTDMADFRSFHIDNVMEEVAYRASVIRAKDKRPVIAHAWGGGAVTCANLGAMAFDDWKNALPVDMWGYSAFPSDNRSGSVLGLGTDATRCAGQGKVVWQSELGAGDVGAGLNRAGRVPAKTVANWTWESIRHGAKGMLYWQYRKEAHGREFGIPAMTDYDGGPTDNSREIERICKAIARNDALFMNARVETAQVALVFSVQSYLVDWCDNRDSNLSIECMSGYYRMFWERNIPVDIVHEDFTDADRLAAYKLVILPTPWALSANVRAALLAYVERGGTLLSDPYFCPYTPDKQLDTQVPGGGFARVFGAHELDIYDAKRAPVTLVLEGERVALRNGHMWERFRDVQARVLATYADGGAAILANAYGKGSAYLSGVNLGLEYAPRVAISEHLEGRDRTGACETVRDFVLNLAARAGVAPSIDTRDARVQASLLTDDAGDCDLLIAISVAAEDGTVAIRVPDRYTRYESILTGARGEVRVGEFTLPMQSEGCEALRMLKTAGA